jgi:hypothetical protein
LKERLKLTTTNVCKHELQNHVNSNRYPPEGSREHHLKQGSQRVLDHLDDDDSSWSYVTVVLRPHGPDAGEECDPVDIVLAAVTAPCILAVAYALYEHLALTPGVVWGPLFVALATALLALAVLADAAIERLTDTPPV